MLSVIVCFVAFNCFPLVVYGLFGVVLVVFGSVRLWLFDPCCIVFSLFGVVCL